MITLSMFKFHASLFAGILTIALLTPASHAQASGAPINVDVPFAFQNGSQHFAAGRYTIGKTNQNILLVRGKSHSGFAMAWSDIDPRPSTTTKVVFRRYGDQYFLREVWLTGESSHTYCLPTKAEKQLQVAGNRTVPTGVEVALLGTPDN